MENFSDATIIGPGEVRDRSTGRTLKVYPDVASIFALFREHGVPIAIASASPAATTAARTLRAFGLGAPSVPAQVYPGKKDAHLKAIAKALGVSLTRALFFDDLPHNIKAAEALGVGGAVQIRGGLSTDDVRRALRQLRERSKGAAMMRAFSAVMMAAAVSASPVSSTDLPLRSRTLLLLRCPVGA